jgi:GT2 family glycosyltransferase
MEILVVDGGSTDQTRDILTAYSKLNPVVKMMDNPYRLKPHALNIGIKAAVGDIVIRMDAHAVYDKSYVSKSVRYLGEYRAENVGGRLMTLSRGTSLISKTIAHILSSPFGVGNSTFRTGAKGRTWVDTVFGGCYWRNTFEKTGLFDETLVRGQDREFNMRLQKVGGRILFAPDIVCYYYARGTLGTYIPWIYSAGLTPFFVSRLSGKRIFSWRNLAPPLFVLSLIILPLLASVHPIFLWFLGAETILYVVCAVVAAIPVVNIEKDIRFLASMPFVFALTHITYGIGSLIGLFKSVKGAGEWTKV